MYTPESLRPPPLVDPEDVGYGNPPFIPPPHGVTNGGQPGPGWGPGWNYPSSSDWPRRGTYGNGTPYPHNAALPSGGWASSSGGGGGGAPPGWSTSPPSAPPLNSAHSWTYGHTQTTPNSPWPAWAQTSANSWGPQTPGGGWGPAPPASPYTPWGYPSPYTQPTSAPAQPPGSPYDSASGQPITGGWFGAGGGGAATGGGGGGTWGSAAANGGGGGGTWGSAAANGGGGGGTWGGAWANGGGGGTWQEGTWVQEKKKKKRRSDHGHEWPHLSEGEDGEYRLGRSSSIRRSHSNAASPRRSKSLQRSASWGNGNEAYGGWYGSTPPQYAQSDLFDEHNLARRPRDWRPDYTVRGGLGAYITLVAKNRSNVKEWNDNVRRHLHPLLSYDPANPPIYYDLRQEPFEPRDVEFLNLPARREANQIDFAQLALQPTCALMRIYHPKLPWYIDVQQSHPNGVTVFDIISQMHAQLHTSIHPRHFWNEELGEAERNVLTKAFQERVHGDARLVQRGILQVDFLGEKCVFEGLVRGPKGLWELKLGREQP